MASSQAPQAQPVASTVTSSTKSTAIFNTPYNTGYSSGPTSKTSSTTTTTTTSVDGEQVVVSAANNDPRFKDNVVVGATSRGNYDRYIEERDGDNIMNKCLVGSCDDPVVYPANTYMHNTMLIRDTADESSYSRVSN